MKALSAVNYNLHENIRDFGLYIEEKTHDFTGRGFVYSAIEEFIKEDPRGYFLITGDPGIGKTALAAQYVKQIGCVHHF